MTIITQMNLKVHNETRKIIMLHIIRKMRNTMSIYNYTSDQ